MNAKDASELLMEIKRQKYKANTWEASFIVYVENKINTGAKFTSKEANKLCEVYAKATGGGMYERRKIIGRT